jgi:hypothetical protein
MQPVVRWQAPDAVQPRRRDPGDHAWVPAAEERGAGSLPRGDLAVGEDDDAADRGSPRPAGLAGASDCGRGQTDVEEILPGRDAGGEERAETVTVGSGETHEPSVGHSGRKP